MSETKPVDVLIVGGGPAGLAAALWLGRHRLETVVADRGEHRNRWVDASFGYLGFDGSAPDALVKAGRADLDRYPNVTLLESTVRALHRTDEGFHAEVDGRTLRCSAVVFAGGVRDVVPPLAGLRDHYGTSVYVCPLCDGYECREQRVVILGAGGSVGAFAQELLQWASSVVVVPLGDERPTDALPDGVTCTDHPATAVHGSSCVERVELKDGSTVPCDAIFFRSETIPATDMAADVGCDLDEDGLVIVDADGCASAPDVYAAGDCTPGPRIVQVAAAEGARAGLQCAETLMARR